MKFSVALLILGATSFTMAAPLQSEENVSLKPRNEIFARVGILSQVSEQTGLTTD